MQAPAPEESPSRKAKSGDRAVKSKLLSSLDAELTGDAIFPGLGAGIRSAEMNQEFHTGSRKAGSLRHEKVRYGVPRPVDFGGGGSFFARFVMLPLSPVHMGIVGRSDAIV